MKRGTKIVIGLAGLLCIGTAASFYVKKSAQADVSKSAEAIGALVANAAAPIFTIKLDSTHRNRVYDLNRDQLPLSTLSDQAEIVQGNVQRMHTFANALVVAQQVQAKKIKVPITSLELPGQLRPQSLDGWNHPFCISGNDKTLVVISSGIRKDPVRCNGKLDTVSLDDVPRFRLIEMENGVMVMLFSRKPLESLRSEAE
jgi:hypothetical protein